MPLYARPVAEHYLDRERSASADSFVVLSGAYEAGSFHRIPNGPSEGHWSWSAGLGAATANFVASGYAMSPEQCRILSPKRSAECSPAPICANDRTQGRDHRAGSRRKRPTGRPDRCRPTIAQTISCPVRCCATNGASRYGSGELIVGLLVRSTHGPERWWWSLSGVDRPEGKDFVWQGDAATEGDAFDQVELTWARWTYWAGLESVAPLQRGG